MYALMGVGLALIFGILGIVNFAHGELFMLGTYAMFFCGGAGPAVHRRLRPRRHSCSWSAC